MRKTIKIGTKEYEMQSSAYTQFKYKDETGKSLIKDLTSIANDYKDYSNEEILEEYDKVDEIVNKALRIAYIMCLEAKSFNGNFEDFLKGIDDYLSDPNWISEVIELAISPLSGNIQTTKQ
jgi:phosphate uptake regulator